MRTRDYRPATVALGLAVVSSVLTVSRAGEPVAVRAEHFVVPPATGPVTHVVAQNLLDKPYQGTIRLKLPEGWQVNPAARPVVLQPGETLRLPFAIERGANLETNAYPIEVVAEGGGTKVVRQQTVFCASAPYYKPKIDGRLGDWDDAIPITFLTQGKKTVVRTYWNKSQFCLAVEVEEDDRLGYRGEPGAKGFDAVQFALAPRDARTGTRPTDEATRYEFLLVGSRSMFYRDKCFVLLKPGDELSAAPQERSLEPLRCAEALVSVRRSRGITRYECAVPFAILPAIEPRVGKEIRFSVLVHDPDGTGIRDYGEAAGLWPSQRNRLAWCSWKGARWGDTVPFDGKIEHGLCTSKR